MAITRRVIPALIGCGILLAEAWDGARAQGKFMGEDLVPAAADSFLVLRDVNIRAKPKTASRRIGRLGKGTRIRVRGRARKSQWIAVLKEGRDLGFVYASVLAPLIDGRLDVPLRGKLTARGRPPCGFELQFTAKSKVAGELLSTFDYEVSLRCTYKSKKLAFPALMFVTETPYLDIRKPIYQINVDVLEIPDEEVSVLTLTALYHPRKKKVVFDGLSNAAMGDERKLASKPAASVAAALRGALEMAHAAWGPRFWSAIDKR